MGIITRSPDDFESGKPIISADVDNNFNVIYNEFNGSIDTNNISDTAGILIGQLATPITTAGVISSSALTISTTDISNLYSTPQPITIAANIAATNAQLNKVFTITVDDDFTLENPSNPTTGQFVIWRFDIDATGGWDITLDSDFRTAENLGTIRLTQTASTVDYMGAIYTGSNWDIISYARNIA